MGIDETLKEAARHIKEAVENEGPMPQHHRNVMNSHRAEWPTLWAAIDDLIIVLRVEEGTYESTRKSN